MVSAKVVLSMLYYVVCFFCGTAGWNVGLPRAGGRMLDYSTRHTR